MRPSWIRCASLLGILGCCLLAAPADAGIKDLKNKVKSKVEKKADEKVDQKIDQAVDKAAGEDAAAAEPSGGEQQQEPEAEDAAASAPAAGGTAAAEDMTLFTKFDFVPGDNAMFYDDLADEELGEFPSRWGLDQGVFEVAEQGGEKWILCTDKGIIRPKLGVSSLPAKYTIEMEFWTKGPQEAGHWYTLVWFGETSEVARLRLQDNQNTSLTVDTKQLASKSLLKPLEKGKHTLRVMVTPRSIKGYLDSERIANVPAVEGWHPVGVGVECDPWAKEDNPLLIRAYRFAEGGKTLREQLDESGRIVTHGILFDSGSSRIKGESQQTLKEIGQLLTGDPALKLSVEGHTDSDGADDANLALSQARAEAVKVYLSEAFKLDAGRLSTQGFGETKPLGPNASPEGKANNRRVELVKS